MLDQITKRKLDSARNILVGNVTNPISQVEQITNALIYKFMDDMDQENLEVDLKPQFFIDEYKQYSWRKLMDKKLSGQERFNLYEEATKKLTYAKHIPTLFRTIFENARLPYNDPRVLTLFLKEIDGFSYSHSEELGNAFEYLLSILGSQGDAGMFRTPRHIIDFIVEVVDPKKNETILDPACGTAGFLISAYKHILKTNKEKPLTPDEKLKLMNNLAGYDISPDMVKLSLVNMYLHGFQNPQIYKYDTLSSEKRWDETFDVIMANPPFMTPKGGIVPHKRFSIQANRAEVLFVDYIVEHLTIKGRAGIIVPEGIIFQSNNAYTQLRKKLVEDGLFAVVSLPAGVFNPYAGVKTSILLFDNEISKKTKNFLFLKIKNDGFDLGAQRREHDKNDLPFALEIIKKYRSSLNDKDFEFNENEKQVAHLVAKEKIIATGDYNLSGDRYRESISTKDQKWPLVELDEYVELNRGVVYSKKDEVSKDGFKILRANNISLDGNLVLEDIKLVSKNLKLKESQKLKANDIFICVASGSKDHIGKVAFIKKDTDCYFGGFMGAIRVKSGVNPLYIFYLLRDKRFNDYLNQVISGANINNLNAGILSRYKIPLPPIEVQKEIVEQIEVKQNAIDHAKAIIKNLERERRYFGQALRKLEGVEWVELGSVCKTTSGGTPLKEKLEYYKNGTIPWLKSGEVAQGLVYSSEEKITDLGLRNSSAKIFPVNTVLVAMYGATAGKVGLLKFESTTNQAICGILPNEKFLPEFLYMYLRAMTDEMVKLSGGGAQPNISQTVIKTLKIPLPSLEIQKKLVAEAEREQEVINANKQLIEIMEQKISDVLSEI